MRKYRRLVFHRGRDLPVCVEDSPAGGALQWGGLPHCDRRECQPPGGERHQKLVECRGYARDRNPRRGRKIRCFPWKKVCIVSQTTFNYNKFQELVEIIKEKGYDIIVLNTICNATEERQTEARAIAEQVDAMIVIGGRNSSNTQKLFEICKNECKNTYYIQTVKDLDLAEVRSVDNVGITAGASTPNNIIEEVQKNVRNEL